MMYKCKNCFGLLNQKGSDYVCPFCGAQYSRFDFETGSGPSSKNRGTNGSGTKHGALSGEQVYDLCIHGAAEIVCLDLGCAGSGFLAMSDGIVITNAHVVTSEGGRQSREVLVKIDNKQYPASIVKCGHRDRLDVAFLKIRSTIPGVSPLTLGNSDETRNGETVYAIGNSMGDGLCIVKGIISDNHRIMEGQSFIMCDVATNQGNSGGPLINESGQVIAICVSQRVGNEYGVAGMRYFIPINAIMEFWGK